jgi:hypothetical protein
MTLPHYETTPMENFWAMVDTIKTQNGTPRSAKW